MDHMGSESGRDRAGQEKSQVAEISGLDRLSCGGNSFTELPER
jgi:hypothetical protein